jgi:hypothetical protein
MIMGAVFFLLQTSHAQTRYSVRLADDLMDEDWALTATSSSPLYPDVVHVPELPVAPVGRLRHPPFTTPFMRSGFFLMVA